MTTALGRIYWTDEEKQHVVSETAKRLLAHPTKPILEIVRGIVGQMPQDRQRQIITLKAVPWFDGAIKLEMDRQIGMDRKAGLEAAPLRARCTELEASKAALEERCKSLEEMVSVTPNVEEALDSASATQLMAALQAKLALRGMFFWDRVLDVGRSLAEMADRLEDIVTRPPGTPSSAVHKAKPSSNGAHKRLPIVSIAGFTAPQFQTVATAFDKVAVLNHIDVTGKNAKPMRQLPSADLGVVVAKFCDHPTQNNMIAAYGRDNVIIVPPSGGITQTARLLRERLKARK